MNEDTMNTEPDRAVPGIESLRRDQAPRRDLWPEIEQRIAPRRRRRPPAWMAMAASVLLVVGVLNLPTGPQDTPTGSAPAVTTPVALAPSMLSPPQRAVVKAHLQIADHAERELKAALRQAPDSPQLRQLLRSTQAQQEQMRTLL